MKFLTYLTLVTFLSACSKGTRIGNPTTTVTFNIVGSAPSLSNLSLNNWIINNTFENFSNYNISSNPSLTITDSSGASIGTLNLTGALIGLSEIKFRNTLTEEDTIADFEGPYLVNLLTQTTTPAFDAIDLAAEDYNQIKIKLDKIEEGDVTTNPGLGLNPGDVFIGNSIRITGTYTGTTASGSVNSMPTTLEFDFDEEFELNASTGKSLDLNDVSSTDILVAFRLARWFNLSNTATNSGGYDFGDITPQSGQIILNENSGGNESQLRAAIKENIKRSADFGIDSNNDGSLDASEDSDELESENESDWD